VAADSFDDDLVRRAKSGDDLAAPMLISVLGDRLLGFARSLGPGLSDPDREQIVELAVEAGVRAIEKFDPKRGTLYSWFRQQVRYQTLQWFRTHPPTGPQIADIAEVSEPASSSWMDEPEVRDGLHAAIAQLSRDDRIILALRNVEGMAYSEIAQRLELNVDTTRQRHKRALQRLRNIAMNDEALTRRFTTPKEGKIR
jgi:RNA polymerase sigma-70 factor (ECF subfamily)